MLPLAENSSSMLPYLVSSLQATKGYLKRAKCMMSLTAHDCNILAGLVKRLPN